MYEFVINESKLSSFGYLAGFLDDLSNTCTSRLQVLGLSD